MKQNTSKLRIPFWVTAQLLYLRSSSAPLATRDEINKLTKPPADLQFTFAALHATCMCVSSFKSTV